MNEWLRHSILLFLAAWLATADTVSAQPVVYYSPADDGTNPNSSVYYPLGGNRTLYLYGDGGTLASSSGVVCEDGSGEEICGWDVLVEAREGVTFTAFRPEGDIHHALGATTLRFHGGDHQTGQLGPTKLGELDIDTSAEGSAQLSGGQAVDAGLDLHDLRPARLTQVPEPGVGVGLLAGSALLVLLGRKRRSD
jgi:hypothetical protein